jgi:hypothetical protein
MIAFEQAGDRCNRVAGVRKQVAEELPCLDGVLIAAPPTETIPVDPQVLGGQVDDPLVSVVRVYWMQRKHASTPHDR